MTHIHTHTLMTLALTLALALILTLTLKGRKGKCIKSPFPWRQRFSGTEHGIDGPRLRERPRISGALFCQHTILTDWRDANM